MLGRIGTKFGVKRGGKLPPPGPVSLPQLRAIALSSNLITENAAPGTVLASLLNTTAGVAPVLSNNAGNRLALSGSNLAVGATNTDYETTTTLSIAFTQTDAGYGNSPLVTNLTLNVVNQNDTNPNAFVFTDVSSAALSTVETSNTITIAGLGASDSAAASIAGDASSQLQKNGGAWGGGPATVVNGDTLAVRHTSSGAFATAVNTTLTVGTTSDTFTSTTQASGTSPMIARFTASGIKRQSEAVWLAIEDDGTADKRKFDVQVGGVSLTGVTVRDGATSATVNFPYVTTSASISFDIPAALVGAAYAINGYASNDNGATWSSPTTADEFFGETAGAYFTPATRSAPTGIRATLSGVTPMQFELDGGFYDSDLIRIYHYDSTNTLLEISNVSVTEAQLGSPFLIDLSGATDPAPYPPLSAGASTDYYVFRITSGDFAVTEGDVPISGVASSGVTIYVSDALSAMVWSGTDKTSGITVSGGGLIASHGGGWGTVRASRPVAFDKIYAEFTPDSAIVEVGICDGGVTLPSGASAYWGSTAFGQVATNEAVGWQGNDSQLYYNNAYTGIGSFSASVPVGIAWDRVAQKIWLREGSGAWLPSGDPATGTGGFAAPGLNGASGFFPYVQVDNGHSATANFGTTPGATAGFTNAPPTGFVAP